jgi:NAD(P)-dependent dehydrogenase (short-subunit alcohol dehydrogenase family)
MAGFLVSREAAYVTGATMFVDGGYACGIPRY